MSFWAQYAENPPNLGVEKSLYENRLKRAYCAECNQIISTEQFITYCGLNGCQGHCPCGAVVDRD
jgi:hypothetical protein